MDYLHIALALGIMCSYLAAPLTALRRLPLTTTTFVSGAFFFATCAITHLALAVGFHDSPWMILNDAIQFIAVVTFLVSLSRQVSHALKYREAYHNGGKR